MQTNVTFSSSDAYECAKMLCEQYYLGSPELELREINGEDFNHLFSILLQCITLKCFSLLRKVFDIDLSSKHALKFVFCSKEQVPTNPDILRSFSSLPHGFRALQGRHEAFVLHSHLDFLICDSGVILYI